MLLQPAKTACAGDSIMMLGVFGVVLIRFFLFSAVELLREQRTHPPRDNPFLLT